MNEQKRRNAQNDKHKKKTEKKKAKTNLNELSIAMKT